MRNRKIIKDFLIITFGIFLTAVSVHFFLAPGDLVVGSIAGLALVLSQLVPLPISIITLLLNIFLFALGYITVGKEFGLKTFYTTVMLSVFIFIFEQVFPMNTSIMGDSWLDLLCFVGIIGLAQAILFRQNASSGGLDIVAKILNKYLHMELGVAIMLLGVIISLSSFLVYDIRTTILGLIGTFLNGFILDHFTVSFNSKKRVCIISDQYEIIQDFIIHTLARGVTLYPVYGGYQNTRKTEIETLLTRTEFISLMQFMSKTDPNAFMTAGNVSEIYGKWRLKEDLKHTGSTK